MGENQAKKEADLLSQKSLAQEALDVANDKLKKKTLAKKAFAKKTGTKLLKTLRVSLG